MAPSSLNPMGTLLGIFAATMGMIAVGVIVWKLVQRQEQSDDRR